MKGKSLQFEAIINKFGNKGEKTGWTYIDIPQHIILKLKLTNKKEFRIKGVMDDVAFDRLAFIQLVMVILLLQLMPSFGKN